MATLFQLIKKIRQKKRHINRVPQLEKKPQRKGLVNKLIIITPRKPHSARRKVAKVYVKSCYRKLFFTYIPGMGHNLKKYSVVLLRGGRVKDLPGVKYHLIPGVYDFFTAFLQRKKKRSKYGLKKIR